MREGEFMNHVYRMGEFYDAGEIDYFLHNVRINNLDQVDAMRWLDHTTIFNYTTKPNKGLETTIDEMLIEYLLGYGKR